MIPVLEGKVPVAVAASRQRSSHDAILFADKQHIRIVILQPREAKAADELKAKNIPVILGRTEALPENEDAPYDQGESLPSEFYKAGVKFAFNAASNALARNTPFAPAPVTATRTPPAVLATNTPTSA